VPAAAAPRQQQGTGKLLSPLPTEQAQLVVPDLRSNAALCATSGSSPTKSATSRITVATGGALRSMALLMPVSCSICAGIRTPAFIRLW
jgi:hypothetical protein